MVLGLQSTNQSGKHQYTQQLVSLGYCSVSCTWLAAVATHASKLSKLTGFAGLKKVGWSVRLQRPVIDRPQTLLTEQWSKMVHGRAVRVELEYPPVPHGGRCQAQSALDDPTSFFANATGYL